MGKILAHVWLAASYHGGQGAALLRVRLGQVCLETKVPAELLVALKAWEEPGESGGAGGRREEGHQGGAGRVAEGADGGAESMLGREACKSELFQSIFVVSDP